MTTDATMAFDAMRDLADALISEIDAWRRDAADPGDFRPRLLRAHALAVLDEIAQCAAGPAPSGGSAGGRAG
jgi:hypothetical protein